MPYMNDYYMVLGSPTGRIHGSGSGEVKAGEKPLSITPKNEFGESASSPHKLASMDLEALDYRRKCKMLPVGE